MRFIAKLFFIVLIFGVNIGLQSSSPKSTPGYLSKITQPNRPKSVMSQIVFKQPAVEDQERLSTQDLVELSKQFKKAFEKKYPDKAGTVSDAAFLSIIDNTYKELSAHSKPKNLQDPSSIKIVHLALEQFAAKLELPKAGGFAEPVAEPQDTEEPWMGLSTPTAPIFDSTHDGTYLDPYALVDTNNLVNIELRLLHASFRYHDLINMNFADKTDLYNKRYVDTVIAALDLDGIIGTGVDESKSLENPNLLGSTNSYQQIIEGLARNNRQRDDLKATLELNNDYQNVAVIEYVYKYLGNDYELLVADDLQTKVDFIKTMLLSDWYD